MSKDLFTFALTCVATLVRLVLAIATSTSSTSPMRVSDNLLNCDVVRRLFLKSSTDSKMFVPNRRPFHESSMKICFDGQSRKLHRTCCTYADELRYLKTAEQKLRFEITSQNSQLLTILTERLSFFRDKFLLLINMLERKTDDLLQESYSILRGKDRKAILNNVFSSLRDHLLGEHSQNIPDIVKKFFDEIFPHIFYKQNLTDGTILTFTSDYKRCVINMRIHIHPQPFGIVPNRVTSGLLYSFTVTRSFLKSIHLLKQSLEATARSNVSSSCLTALTRMHLCALCEGRANVRPCRGLCLNVQRGCFAKMTEYSPEWDELISSMKVLCNRMKGPAGFDAFLDVFVSQVSEALLHANSLQRRFFKEITSIKNCGPLKVVSRMTDRRQRSADGHSTRKMPDGGMDIYRDIRAFVDDVMKYHGWHTKIGDVICNNSLLYEQSLASQYCWNGNHVSLYNKQIPDPYIIGQMRHNPEVSVARVPNPIMLELRQKMALFTKSINVVQYVDYDREVEQSDDIGEVSAREHVYKDDAYRGRSFWVNKDNRIFDDEDDISGSGSGDDGSGKDSNDDENTRNKNKSKTSDKNGMSKSSDEFEFDSSEVEVDKDRTVEGRAASYSRTFHLSILTHYLTSLYSVWLLR